MSIVNQLFFSTGDFKLFAYMRANSALHHNWAKYHLQLFFLLLNFPNNSCPPSAPMRVKLVPSPCRTSKSSKMVSFETDHFEGEAKSRINPNNKSYGSHQTVFECTNEDEETKLCSTPQKAPQVYAALAGDLIIYCIE